MLNLVAWVFFDLVELHFVEILHGGHLVRRSFVAFDAAHHVLHRALVVHLDGVDDAGTRQGLRDMLLMDGLTAVELF